MSPPRSPSASDLEVVFAALFADSHCIELVGGGAEPTYTAAREGAPARLQYREDFVSSALHEVAHWCVAGPARRARDDFGYWYSPDGRTAEEQARFEANEVQPQALEWVFSLACGVSFRPSADNVEAGLTPGGAFVTALAARKDALLAGALQGRALQFRDALAQRFGPLPCRP